MKSVAPQCVVVPSAAQRGTGTELIAAVGSVSSAMTAGRSVVVASTADGVTRSPHQHHEQADDQQDDPDDKYDMGEGERGDETGEE